MAEHRQLKARQADYLLQHRLAARKMRNERDELLKFKREREAEVVMRNREVPNALTF